MRFSSFHSNHFGPKFIQCSCLFSLLCSILWCLYFCLWGGIAISFGKVFSTIFIIIIFPSMLMMFCCHIHCRSIWSWVNIALLVFLAASSWHQNKSVAPLLLELSTWEIVSALLIECQFCYCHSTKIQVTVKTHFKI